MFTGQQNEISLCAENFGHSAGVSFLQHLFKIDSCYYDDLVAEVGLSQPKIRQHSKELTYLGLIKENVRGQVFAIASTSKIGPK